MLTYDIVEEFLLRKVNKMYYFRYDDEKKVKYKIPFKLNKNKIITWDEIKLLYFAKEKLIENVESKIRDLLKKYKQLLVIKKSQSMGNIRFKGF